MGGRQEAGGVVFLNVIFENFGEVEAEKQKGCS